MHIYNIAVGYAGINVIADTKENAIKQARTLRDRYTQEGIRVKEVATYVDGKWHRLDGRDTQIICTIS